MSRPVFTAVLGVLSAIHAGQPPDDGPDPTSESAAASGRAPDVLERLEERISEASTRARASVVALEYAAGDAPPGARRVATGVVVNEDGDVVSVRIDRPPAAAPVIARDASGRRHPARWLAADPATGLTLLRIEPRLVPPARASTQGPRLGSEVLVIGNPFGLGHSVSRGSVSGLDRRLELGTHQLGGLIQVAVALQPGDSGALVADLRGRWLGLIRSGLAAPDARPAHGPGLGFAITAGDALWVAGQLRAHQRVERAYFGVRLGPRVEDESPGATLGEVLAGTPAARAGLRAGDRVVMLDGCPIRSADDLTDRLDRTLAEVEAALEYQRGPRRDRVTLRTARRPTPLTPVASAAAPPAGAASGRADELRLALPREVLDRLERLERRVEELEKRSPP